MQRFYIENFLKEDNFILKEKGNYNSLFYQLLKVLRVKIWEKVIFFDWKNLVDYIYEIEKIDKKEIFFKFLHEEIKHISNNLVINLYNSLPNKLEKIELILQKWVEVWISNFVFFSSERSQKLFINESRMNRLEKIIIEAVEQSGGNIIPSFTFYDSGDIFSKIDKKSQNIFFHTKNDNSKLLRQLDFTWNINLFVWPEWGFSDKEICTFEKNNFVRIYLWERILRTETVWIWAAFFINNFLLKKI